MARNTTTFSSPNGTPWKLRDFQPAQYRPCLAARLWLLHVFGDFVGGAGGPGGTKRSWRPVSLRLNEQMSLVFFGRFQIRGFVSYVQREIVGMHETL